MSGTVDPIQGLATKLAMLIGLKGVATEHLNDQKIDELIAAVADTTIVAEKDNVVGSDADKARQLREQLRPLLETKISFAESEEKAKAVEAAAVNTTEDVPPLRDAPLPNVPPVGEQEENSTAGQGGWKSYGTLVLGALGILAWIGSLFSSEEGSKGKAVFAGIGGLLFGGALLSQWPGIGKLFGRAIEAVRGVVQPDNGAATETH